MCGEINTGRHDQGPETFYQRFYAPCIQRITLVVVDILLMIYHKQKRWRRTLWELTCTVLQRLCSCKAAVIEGKRFFATFFKTFYIYLFINLPSRIFCYVIHVLEYTCIIAFTLLCFTHLEHLGNFTKIV